MLRIEQATLSARAFHTPEKLADEQRLAIADAGPAGPEREDLLALGRQMVADIDGHGVMD